MSHKDYNINDLEVLSASLHIRKRPKMYVGSLDTTGLRFLLSELLSWSANQARNGVMVSVSGDGAVTVRDDGPGLPVHPHDRTGECILSLLFTQLHCGGSDTDALVVVCALSEHLLVETTQNDSLGWPRLFSMEFAAGSALGPLKQEVTCKGGTRITFKPDPAIFGEAVITVEQAEQIAKLTREQHPQKMVIVGTEEPSQ